jgi:hypothetical protein
MKEEYQKVQSATMGRLRNEETDDKKIKELKNGENP